MKENIDYAEKRHFLTLLSRADSFALTHIIAEEDFVTFRFSAEATHQGNFMGNPPSGNRVSVPLIFTDEFNAEGKEKVRYVQFDTGAFNSQLMAQK